MNKNELFILQEDIFVDKLFWFEKINKDLYVIELTYHNRMFISEYCRHLTKVEFMLPLQNQYWIVDKYGKIVDTKNFDFYKGYKKQWYKNMIKKYNQFKKDIDYNSYKLKQLMRYVYYKVQLKEYD